jgi:hypothetical protein
LREFVVFLEDGDIEITGGNLSGLSHLCAEFGFILLSVRLRDFGLSRAISRCFRCSDAVGAVGAGLPVRDFTFLINGRGFETSRATAVALSPGVADLLSVDGCVRSFSVLADWAGDLGIEGFLSGFDSGLSSIAGLSGLSGIGAVERRSLGLLFGRLSNADLEAAFLGCEIGSDSLSLLSVDALSSLLSEAFPIFGNADSIFSMIRHRGDSYFGLLGHIGWVELSIEAICEFEADASVIPPESVWRGIADFLGQFGRIANRSPAGFDSAIVSEFPNLLDDFCGKDFTLLWRGSRDGFGASDFHERCDGHSHTLTLIEDTSGNIFGGFTPTAWESLLWNWESGDASSSIKADPSLASFLFTLKNPHDFPAHKFSLKSSRKHRAIHCYSSCGPHFWNIAVSDHCNATTHNLACFLGDDDSYANDTGLDGVTVFTGSRYFRVKEIEVFEMTD